MDDDGRGELDACVREGDKLKRVRTGLGDEVDAALRRVLERILDANELPLADRLWQHVLDADRRGIYSRLVGWIRTMDTVGIPTIRCMIDGGPSMHPYHDQAGKDSMPGKIAEL